MGIGDVTLPLPPACIAAFHEGVEELASADTFKGYGPEQGYEFLREAIAKNDFQTRGVSIQPDEIFISDGSKCDTGNFQELFAQDIRIAVPDPVYPVYVDTNVMAGRTGKYHQNLIRRPRLSRFYGEKRLWFLLPLTKRWIDIPLFPQ